MDSEEFALLREALRELTYSEARLLVVDDDPAMVMFLQGLLERVGYTRVVSTTDAVLLKPERLTPDEFEVVGMHPSIGARILSGGRSDYLAVAEQIAPGHHERWDGHGYPQGIAADEVPLPVRIVAVADFFDVLTHDQPHPAGAGGSAPGA